eukprot:scaffold1954_cov268-Pinguiococcus_pyrenoidosus.AAC.90
MPRRERPRSRPVSRICQPTRLRSRRRPTAPMPKSRAAAAVAAVAAAAAGGCRKSPGERMCSPEHVQETLNDPCARL